MAKRRRLIPTVADLADFEPVHAETGRIDTALTETKAFLRPGLGAPAPIARVAGEAAAHAALSEMSEAMVRARQEGRLVLRLPLDQIDTDHLMRDRIGLDEEELAPLVASLRDHGQRTPVEVTELPGGRFGLISGWRRIQALTRLLSETGESRFAEVQALLRRPDSAQDAYIAMVEENEIRLGLSYYERARIAARAVDAGVFETEKQALQRLFSSASRARRSKIGSFLSLYRLLDPVLRFPAAIPERLGLALARALEERPADVASLTMDLRMRPPADAIAEQARLSAFAAGKTLGKSGSDPAQKDSLPPEAPTLTSRRRELCPGVFLQTTGDASNPTLTLSGPKVDPEFRTALEAWLSGRA